MWSIELALNTAPDIDALIWTKASAHCISIAMNYSVVSNDCTLFATLRDVSAG
jgi:hypothetical protein